MKDTPIVLNKDIHQFDKKEKHIKKNEHSLKEWIQRIIVHYKDKWFEPTYKEEYENQNLQIDIMSRRITILQRNNKTLMKKITRLEKRLEKYEEKRFRKY